MNIYNIYIKNYYCIALKIYWLIRNSNIHLCNSIKNILFTVTSKKLNEIVKENCQKWRNKRNSTSKNTKNIQIIMQSIIYLLSDLMDIAPVNAKYRVGG